MAINSRDKRFSLMRLFSPVRVNLPVPDGAISTADRLHWIGLYRGIAADAPVSTDIIFIDLGDVHLHTDQGGGTPFLEAFYRAETGTVHVRLWDRTALAAVANSTNSLTATSLTRQRSVALTLVDGNEYEVQFGKAGSDTGEARGAKIVMVF